MDINQIDQSANLIQQVKQRFFALRNGMLADMLRHVGSPYRIIFGLNLPQLREIADAFGNNPELARQLWANSSTRESRLIAPMLADAQSFTLQEADTWIAGLNGTTEEVDVLCHSLLRRTSFVNELINKYASSPKAIERYLALRLAFSIVNKDPQKALDLATAEIDRNDALTLSVAHQLADEARFILGD